ncbi:unnamed protein product [Scytosiphon promiscuus]
MARPTLLSRSWLSTCALLAIPLVRKTSGWLVRPTCPAARSTCGRCLDIQLGGPLRRTTRTRIRSRPAALNASADENDEGAGAGNTAGGAGSGSNKGGAAGAAAAVPRHQKQKGKQQRVQAAEDNDAPIFYIKGLKEGGGVGVWGGNGSSEDPESGGDAPRARGGGNAAMMARAIRNAEREIEGGGDYEEGVEDGEEGMAAEPVDETPVWEKVQAALGLGVWSYVGLGLAVFIIALNNVLGVGWATKMVNPDYEPDSVLDVQEQGRQIQYMPLDDASNLLSD